MSRDHWHLLRETGAVTLTRRLPARFDLAAEARFPDLRKAVLAHEIRKDLWRMLRDLRGFAPVVRVAEAAGGLTVRAGGRIAGGPPGPATEARIAGLLTDPARRRRWIAHAQRVRP
jgi:hypothetical protein